MSSRSFTRSLSSAALLALVALAPAAAAEPPEGPPWAERVSAALVDVETAWQVASGVLVGDGRTVLLADLVDTGRALHVHRLAAPAVVRDGDARVSADDASSLWILKLDEPLAEQGLTIAAGAPQVGDPVWLVSKVTHDGGTPVASLGETRVTGVAAERFAIGASDLGWRDGTPVLNAAGEVLGMLCFDGRVVRVDPDADRPEPAPRGISVLPVVGLRLGGEAGGLFDGAFTYDVEAGLALWDRLALVTRFGFAIGGTGPGLEPLPATDGLGPGVATTAGDLALRLGFEARYRLYLGGADFPIYVDLAAGLQYAYAPALPSGPAFRSGDVGCDPLVEACALQVSEPGSLPSRDAFDASFGVDVRLGGVVLGYRLLPGLGDAPMAHQFTIGGAVF